MPSAQQARAQSESRSPPPRSACVWLRVEPVDARGDRRLQRGRHTHLRSLRSRGMRPLPRAAPRARPGRARSPRRRTDYRRPARRSSVPLRRPRDPRPSSYRNQRCGFRIAQRPSAIVCAAMHPRQCAFILGAGGDQHQRRRLRDHGEELGQHRLADLIDPMGVLDDIDRRGFAGQRRRHSPVRSTAADGRLDRYWARRIRDRRCPAGHRTAAGPRVGVGNLGAHAIAGGLLV